MTRYGGPVHTGADINIHTHADLFKHMAPTQYARTRTHTQTHTQTIKVTTVVMMEHSEKGK